MNRFGYLILVDLQKRFFGVYTINRSVLSLLPMIAKMRIDRFCNE